MKKCSKCSLDKDECEYYRNHDDCKVCWLDYCQKKRDKNKEEPGYREKRTKYLKEWRSKNKEREKEYTRRSLEKNKEKINERRRTPERRKVNNEAVKRWRLANPEKFKETERLRKARNKEKIYAVARLGQQISRGNLIRPDKCEKCLKECKPEAHHDDYSKPLQVRWLCPPCHGFVHRKPEPIL